MKTFNLTQAVTFPTRICNNKGTLIDSIFLDNTKLNNISVHPFDSGLSDHIAQILTMGNIRIPPSKYKKKKKNRLMDDNSIANFRSYLREEAWDSIYNSIDVNNIFNNFHCILLRHFESRFPNMYKSYRPKHNGWITKGIRISCQRKRDLYSIYRHSNSPNAKEYYKKYSTILKKVIIDAKNCIMTNRLNFHHGI
jgi:hypothetical protein